MQHGSEIQPQRHRACSDEGVELFGVFFNFIPLAFEDKVHCQSLHTLQY